MWHYGQTGTRAFGLPLEDQLARKFLMLAIFGALLTPSFATAVQDPAPSEKKAKICRKAETRTGTRVKTGSKCKTAEEWQKEDEERARIPVSLSVTEGQSDVPARPPR